MSEKQQNVYKRKQQVAEKLFEIVSTTLRCRAVDPRMTQVTFTSVDVSADLKRAIVFYTALVDEDKRAEVAAALNKATGFFQAQVASKGQLRFTPRIKFMWDEFTDSKISLVQFLEKE